VLRSLVLLAPALILAPACQVMGARTFNLNQLHEEDGHHKRLAVQMGDVEYSFHQGFSTLMKQDPTKDLGKAPVRIEDPLAVCVQDLTALSEYEPKTEGEAARKVEAFARYSAIDPWQISRQICLQHLGEAGARLKLAANPPAPEVRADIATPESLRDALAPLIHELAQQSANESRPAVAAACQAIAQMHYDFDGIQRAVAISAALLDRLPPGSKDRSPMLDLVLDLERRTVRMALERGTSDTNVYVRAAAFEAVVNANGGEYLAKVMPRLGTDSGEEVPLAILAMVRDKGLPAVKSGEDPSQSAREGELSLLIKVATEHPVDRVRVSAMQTLGKVSGAGFESLREEDWDAWWHSRTPAAAR
jgi:hypothetical protein